MSLAAANVAVAEVYVDSTQSAQNSSQNANHTYFTFNLGIQQIVGFRIVNVEVPGSYNAISAVNNNFFVSVGGGAPTAIKLTPGNYNVTTFTTMLIAVLAAAFSSGTWTSSVDSNTGQLLLQYTGNYYTISFPKYDSAASVLGFSRFNNNNTFASSGGTNKLTSPYTVNLSGPNYLFLNTTLAQEYSQYTFPIGVPSPNVAARVPVQVTPGAGQTTFWTNPNPNFFLFDPVDVTTFEFYWRTPDDSTVDVDFNGQGFSLTCAVLLRNNSNFVELNVVKGRNLII